MIRIAHALIVAASLLLVAASARANEPPTMRAAAHPQAAPSIPAGAAGRIITAQTVGAPLKIPGTYSGKAERR